MILAIDFDDTLHDTHNVRRGYKMGMPVVGAVEAMQELAKAHKLIIHTTWATSPVRIKALEDWLKYFEIPYHQITSQKPEADAYIDNKAICFINWPDTLTTINSRLHSKDARSQ